MNLYDVDYNVQDVEAYKANPPPLPTQVVASDFKTALALAAKYESDNLSVRELKLAKENIKLAIEEGYAGV